MAFVSKTVTNVAVFLQEARQRYTQGLAQDMEDRTDAIDDVRFAAGGNNQWSREAIDSRKALFRPVITENRLPVYIAQVVNDGRQSKPSIQITPLDNGTEETAEYFQGRIRAVEYDSDADIAYDTSRECQTMSGRGFVRATTEFIPGSTRQKVRIRPIENQFSVLFGPHSEYDCSDSEWCFVIGRCNREEHDRRFGDDTVISRAGFYTDQQNPQPDWVGLGERAEEIQYAEYWVKVWSDHTVCRLPDGSEVDLEDVPDGVNIIERRQERRARVMQYVINGVEILEETEFLADRFGIVPLWGKQLMVDGLRRNYSLIRFAKDPQRLLNLYVSNIAEQIAAVPKAPWLCPVGSVQGYEQIWEAANTQPRAYLPYHDRDASGNPIEKPSKIVSEPPIQALVAGYNQCVDALKASMGLFDAALGAKSNETTGIAIKNRVKESDNANYHFHDNEARSRKSLGRLILCLLRAIETEEQDVSVRSQDGETSTVRINTAEPYRDSKTGQTIHHQTAQGNYGVAVSTGPSFSSQRDAAYDRDALLIQAQPELMFIIGDQLFQNDDTPGHEERSERLKRYIGMKTPGLIDETTAGQPPIPPQAQKALAQSKAMMAQMQQMITSLTAHVTALTQQVQSKDADLASKEKIVQWQEETKRTIALAQINSGEGLQLLESELASVKHRLDLQDQSAGRSHQAGLQQSAQQHAAGMQNADQQHQAGQAGQEQQSDADQAQQQQQHEAGLQDSAQQAQAQQQQQAQEAAAAQPPTPPTQETP